MSEPEGRETAIAVLVAPERMEDAIAALPPDRLVPFIWWIDRLLERAHAAKKAALIEATVALSRMDLDPRLEADGHHYVLREDARQTWQDIPGLLFGLNSMGLSLSEIGRATSELRVTDLRKAAEKIDDPDVRSDVLATIEQHRVAKAGTMALVDLDSPFRQGRRYEARTNSHI